MKITIRVFLIFYSSIFAQVGETPDTVFTKKGPYFSCYITYLDQSIVKVQYKNKSNSGIALNGVSKIHLDTKGIIYTNEKFKIGLDEISQFIQDRNIEHNTPLSTSLGYKYYPKDPQLYDHQSFRIELGVGGGFAGEGGGWSGRFAAAYIGSGYGGIIRFSAQQGGEGETYQSWLFGSVTPTEHFGDAAILGSFVISQNKSYQTILSIGYGVVSGRRFFN